MRSVLLNKEMASHSVHSCRDSQTSLSLVELVCDMITRSMSIRTPEKRMGRIQWYSWVNRAPNIGVADAAIS